MSRGINTADQREVSSYLNSLLSEPNTARPSARAMSSNRGTATAQGAESRAISRSRAVSLGPSADRVLCAITEGRGVATVVGICFVIPSTCELIMCNIVDSQTYIRTLQKLDVFDPDEILMPASSIVPVKSKLCGLVETHFPSARIVETSRKHFNQDAEHELVLDHAFGPERESLGYEMMGKYYMVGAASALLQHIKVKYESQFDMKRLRIKIQASEDSMALNTHTIKSLEVVHNSLEGASGMSLYKLMNHTKTSMGGRILRANLLQPLTRKDSLMRRQDAVEELCRNTEIIKECQQKLEVFEDLDKLLTTMSFQLKKKGTITDRRINQVIMLKDAVTMSLDIAENVLGDVESPLLVELRERLGGAVARKVKELIDEYIQEDTRWAKNPQELRNQRTNAVKAGSNGFLEISRTLFREYTDDFYATARRYVAEYGVPFDHGYDTKRGHFLKVPVHLGSDVEKKLDKDMFIHRRNTRKFIEMTTLDVMKINIRIQNITKEIVLLSDGIIDNLFDELSQRTFDLFMVSEAVAMLDLMCAFAHLATSSTHGYIRPEFTSGVGSGVGDYSNKLAIKLSRHPILDRTMKYKPFIPNDIYASPDTSRMNIITGVNMSGKSVYLRQIALLVIMAQAGSFVPAEFAKMPIYKGLYARIQSDPGDDDMLASSFSAEMTEIAYILHHIRDGTGDSVGGVPEAGAGCRLPDLVLIDELGRGSSVADGLAISLAITDWLVRAPFRAAPTENPQQQGVVTTFMSTHFHDLAKAMGSRPGVAILNMRADIQQNGMTMHYKATKTTVESIDGLLCGGNTSGLSYGLMLAQALPFPAMFLDTAASIRRQLQDASNRQTAATSHTQQMWKQKKRVVDLHEALCHILQMYHVRAATADDNEDKIREWLKFLQDQFFLQASAE